MKRMCGFDGRYVRNIIKGLRQGPEVLFPAGRIAAMDKQTAKRKASMASRDIIRAAGRYIEAERALEEVLRAEHHDEKASRRRTVS